MYVIFSKSREFKVFKYDMDNGYGHAKHGPDGHTNAKTKTQIKTKKCFKDSMHVIFLKSRGC